MTIEKLIFWDIDGTLLHCGSDGRKALNRTFSELYNIADAFVSSDIGGAMDSMILNGIMESHSIEKAHLPDIIQHYRNVLADILKNNKEKRVLPGVRFILDAIEKSSSSKNALLTSNLRIGAMTKLDSLSLDHYFTIGGFGDEPGEKWDAALTCIRQVEEQCKTVFSKDRIFLIGDSTYDIHCAKKVGMTSIAVGTGWADEEALRGCSPDFYFSDLADTGRVLQAIGI
ncbi:HAD hydrolase-like protein [Bacillota bacterium]